MVSDRMSEPAPPMRGISADPAVPGAGDRSRPVV